jgi:FAD/FMN-containing dehydrogenase
MWRISRKQRARAAFAHGVGPGLGSLQAAYPSTFNPDKGRKLRAKLQGEVVLSGDAPYTDSRQLSNAAFQSFPQLIVYCEVFQDVWECLKFARDNHLVITTRSGGHSTAGFSVNDGMVIDTSRLNGVYVDSSRKVAVVGPGTNWGHLNATLADYGLHVPTGICGDVCVAGFMQGGGYGLTSRMFGMNCDNVQEMLVMLADGRIVRASADTNSDLFWAMRGGTGNNFGILLQATYRLHPLRPLWGFGLEWSIEDAPAALVALQADYMGTALPELGYMGALTRLAPTLQPVLIMRGIYWGSKADAHRALQPLLEGTNANLKIDEEGTYMGLNDSLFAGVPPCPDLAREDKQSTNISRPLTEREWGQVCDSFLASPNEWTTVAIEPYGGAIARVDRSATAFVHRGADMNLFVDVFWMEEAKRSSVCAYLDGFMRLVDPMGNGESYQNYPRISQHDYRKRFWAEAFPRLLAIKRKYDPGNTFQYAQSVSPEPGDAWPSPLDEDPIEVEAWGPPALPGSDSRAS